MNDFTVVTPSLFVLQICLLGILFYTFSVIANFYGLSTDAFLPYWIFWGFLAVTVFIVNMNS